MGLECTRAGHVARPSPQAILPLMKFLEVELCYMNTNLVQENFSRSARCLPRGTHHLRLSSTCTSFPPLPQHPFSGEDATGLCLNAHSQGHEAPCSP